MNNSLTTKLILPPAILICFLAACTPTTPTLVVEPPPATLTQTASVSPTEAPTQTPYVITATPGTIVTTSAPEGVFFLSLAENGRSHLFAYSPQTLPLTHLTIDDWDDITPALSPDGNWLAFSSRRNGYWDLYLLELASGGTLRLTDSPEYDAAPSWSPDGAYITYESYVDGNLEIFLRSVTDSSQSAIRLTDNTSLDSSPLWSPLGRQIAFVSNRSGEPEIWIADLDRAGNERFVNISNTVDSSESHPAWSPDGSQLAWAATDPDSGLTSLYIWNARTPTNPARWAGSGDWPVWLDNNQIATRFTSPNQNFLTGFETNNGTLALPPIYLPGPLNGLAFGVTPQSLPGAFLAAAQVTPAAPYVTIPNPQSNIPAGRSALVSLTGVTAPYPQLHELADDSFQALRAQVSSQIGWDALGSLENAFIPLTTTLDPGMGTDWLYTGRAFTFNPALIQAGYMAVVREDFGQLTYWRIYLRTAAQDGSQGTPLKQLPWDFSARTGNPYAYENGGQLSTSTPFGYWLDLTALAQQYNWERQQALTNWRTYYAGTHFNELAFTQGLDWQAAMLQLYPPEILVTPTVVIPPTRTSTRTPLWYRSPTPTRTPTLRPTNTP
jgi:TolB protein